MAAAEIALSTNITSLVPVTWKITRPIHRPAHSFTEPPKGSKVVNFVKYSYARSQTRSYPCRDAINFNASFSISVTFEKDAAPGSARACMKCELSRPEQVCDAWKLTLC